MEHSEGTRVWMSSPAEGGGGVAWHMGTVLSVTEGADGRKMARVRGDEDEGGATAVAERTLPMEELPLQNEHADGSSVADMVELAFMSEPAVLYNLRLRHAANLIYTCARPLPLLHAEARGASPD